MSLANEWNPYYKDTQLAKNRIKPTQKQMGEISAKVDKELKQRSNGRCELQEKCNGAWAVQRAHITARGKLTAKTTVNDLLHVCLECHIWMDREPAGIQFKRKLLKKMEEVEC